jgi:hypothetical protein
MFGQAVFFRGNFRVGEFRGAKIVALASSSGHHAAGIVGGA